MQLHVIDALVYPQKDALDYPHKNHNCLIFKGTNKIITVRNVDMQFISNHRNKLQ